MCDVTKGLLLEEIAASFVIAIQSSTWSEAKAGRDRSCIPTQALMIRR
jgi:hypothetical protein